MCENKLAAQTGSVKLTNNNFFKNLETKYTENIKLRYSKPKITNLE